MSTQRGLNDRLLKDGRLAIEGVSATSAGATNAVVLAYDMLQGNEAGARQALHDFWYAVTPSVERHNPLRCMPWLKGSHSFGLDLRPCGSQSHSSGRGVQKLNYSASYRVQPPPQILPTTTQLES